VLSKGGFDYAQKQMLAYQQKAMEILMTMPNNASRTSLIELLHFVIDRKQ
jgi:geranylgeranyl pyrophosphate synthase